MSDRNKFILYVFFAFVSTAVNLCCQIIVSFAADFSGMDFFGFCLVGNITVKLVTSMFTATIAAFLFKFFIDKFFIFKDTDKNTKENFRQIFFYGFFAVFTTLIFWGFELGFKYLLVFPFSEYLGGFIGLGVGYSLKFILDSRFVFIQPS